MLNRKHLSSLLFLITVLFLYGWFGLYQKLPLKPEGLHFWAQCDRASIAAMYHQQGMHFLTPRLHNLANGTGITGLEFPLMNYAAACLYKLFGFHEIWYRLLMMFVVTAGLMATFSLAKKLLGNEPKAFLATIIWMLSPTLLYYTPNFLADAASMSFIMTGWFCFFTLKDKFSWSILILLFVSTTLGALTKATSVISVCCMFGLLLLDCFGWLDAKKNKLFSNKGILLAALGSSALLMLGWYRYAIHLSEQNYSSFFHLGFDRPATFAAAKEYAHTLYENFLFDYYSSTLLCILAALLVCLLLFAKSVNRTTGLIVLLCGIANTLFMYLQLPKFQFHDYYVITLLPWVFFVLIAALQLIEKKTAALPFASKITLAVLVFLFIQGTGYCDRVLRNRYDHNNTNYFNSDMWACYDIQPLLKEKGMQQEDTIIAFSDATPCGTLYLLNQRGYTIEDDAYSPNLLYLLADRGAKYLVSNKGDIRISPRFNDIAGEPVLRHQNISVYRPNRSPEIKQQIDSMLDVRLADIYQLLQKDRALSEYYAAKARHLNLPFAVMQREAGLKWHRAIELPLQKRFLEFSKNKLADMRQLRAAFAAAGGLSEEEKNIWSNPSETWFP